MKNKEYEMPAEYRQNLELLNEMIKKRDEYTKMLPTLPFKTRVEILPSLRELSKQIEIIEQGLAEEYEQFQAEKRREEERLRLLDKAEETSNLLHVYIKYAKPHKFQEFLDSVFHDWTDEEMQEILDEVTILERTGLKEILGEEMPSPEKIAELAAAGELAFKNRKRTARSEKQD